MSYFPIQSTRIESEGGTNGKMRKSITSTNRRLYS
jgi:hypothetical protein